MKLRKKRRKRNKQPPMPPPVLQQNPDATPEQVIKALFKPTTKPKKT